MAFEAITQTFRKPSRSLILPLLSLSLLVLSFSAKGGEQDEWIWWKPVGSASLTWGFWKIYDSELRTPTGTFAAETNDPLALVITYSRDIDADDLLDATADQWAHLGYTQETIQQWLPLMNEAWPDVKEGDRLAYILRENMGHFFYQPLKGTPTFTKSLESPELAEAFADIWLSPSTAYPKLRLALIGGK